MSWQGDYSDFLHQIDESERIISRIVDTEHVRATFYLSKAMYKKRVTEV
jgi:hypothetical protein